MLSVIDRSRRGWEDGKSDDISCEGRLATRITTSDSGSTCCTYCKVDVHTPVNSNLASQREKNPAFKMSGDGVHVNGDGHRAIAAALLKGLGFDDFESTKVDGNLMGLVRARHQLLRDAWLSEVGHKRPGMKKGKPIVEAEREAGELTKRIGEMKRQKQLVSSPIVG